MKNLAEFYNLKCEKSVQPMGSTSICCTENCPGAFLSCFKLWKLGVIPVLVNTVTGT